MVYNDPHRTVLYNPLLYTLNNQGFFIAQVMSRSYLAKQTLTIHQAILVGHFWNSASLDSHFFPSAGTGHLACRLSTERRENKDSKKMTKMTIGPWN